ncbi:hypothetical protein CYY_001666 [Polysphondylium violaceum]|uniref:Uncharacterized protein n=1 Tax=Polysphondylium violaceum TaxID=133409 RepID=A0A8J4Q2X5_9MYCE|nr:hypothetical protein CYY_001666 [Polysphondylium violaceum]
MKIVQNDISFDLSFPVGKKFVMAEFLLKAGEEVSSAVDQFIDEYDIPIYLRTNLLSTITSLLESESSNIKDLQDKSFFENIDKSTENIKIKSKHLANQYTEKTVYWNKFLKNQETEEQLTIEKRINTFLYLVNKSNDTKERIINQEELFATEFSLLLGKKYDDIRFMNEKHSKEMEHAFKNLLETDQIEKIVASNMNEMELLEANYDQEINDMKVKQKNDFTKFLDDLYWLEKTKDDLEDIEKFNEPTTTWTSAPSTNSNNAANNPRRSSMSIGGIKNLEQQQQANNNTIESAKTSIIDSFDRGVQRASSFFSFDRFKKNDTNTQQQPQQQQTGNSNSGNEKTPVKTSPSTPTTPTPSTAAQPIPTSNNSSSGNNSTSPNGSLSISPNRNRSNSKSKFSTSPNHSSNEQMNNHRKQSIGSSGTGHHSTIQNLKENYVISVGVQKKKLFNFRLIEESPLQLCRPISTGEYKKSKRMDYIQTLYSDSLSALILLVDPELSFSSQIEKNWIKYCNMSTELHFDPVDKQIEQVKQSLMNSGSNDSGYSKTPILHNGDFFITKHSNLSDVQVVFHLVVDSKHRTPLGDSLLPTTSDISKGLRNILLTASKYGIGKITIPIALTDSELDLNITNPQLVPRTVSVLSVTRASLTSLHEMTSIKTIQFSLPPCLDSGNTNASGPIATKWKSAINPFIVNNIDFNN